MSEYKDTEKCQKFKAVSRTKETKGQDNWQSQAIPGFGSMNKQDIGTGLKIKLL